MAATDTAELRQRLQAALGDAYVLERELGGGGMSRVFVAEDARLGRRVVVKVLAPDLAAGVSAARFEREVRLAARLQHPHVVPLLAAGAVGGLPFYTMPYVEGESLRQRFAREGPLPVGDAVRLVRELADALAYAHAQGVVHRDLKPENVLLSGGHAVVADFGVAKALASATQEGGPAVGGTTASATGLGVAVGTPAYMAPEQAAADPGTDHRADLYALGIVAYEALAGAHPFAGRPRQALLAAHLAETPAPLASRRQDVPPALAALVTRLLAKRPDDRVPAAAEVMRALDALATPATGTPAPDRTGRRRPMRARAAAFGAALLVLAGAGLVARDRGPARNDGPATGSPQALPPFVERRVAVAPFENQTGDSALAPLGRLAGDWITQGLSEAGFAEVVDPETIRGAWRAAPTARALAAATRARVVVSGTYYRDGDTLRLLARITDAAEDKLVRALPPVGAPAAHPHRGLTALRDRVLGAVGGLLDVQAATWAATSTLPPSLAAYERWSAGLAHQYRSEWDEAIPEFLAAARLDSTFVAPLLWAAVAYKVLGAYPTADSLLRRAAARSDRLTPADRYSVRIEQAQLRGDWAAALQFAREWLRATPASANALYNVGYHAIRVNRPQEALAAITRADPERPPLRQAPSYWSILTVARHQLGDHAAELRDARRARVLHPDRQQSIRAECRALAALGRTDSLRRPLAASMELRLRAIDTPAGEVMRDAAAELRAHGHEAAARDVFARALAWYDARPAPERATAARRRWRGMVLYDMGRWDDARAAFERLAAEQPRDPEPRGYLGALAARRGDRAAALAADRTLAALREPYLFGRHTYWRARIAALLGERERGVALLRDALQQGRTYLEVHSEADFAPLRAVPAFQELVRPKD